MIPESLSADEECNWVTTLYENKWTNGITAGGCTNFQVSLLLIIINYY